MILLLGQIIIHRLHLNPQLLFIPEAEREECSYLPFSLVNINGRSLLRRVKELRFTCFICMELSTF